MRTLRQLSSTFATVALALAADPARGAAPVYDAGKLRSLVDFPTLSFEMGFTVDPSLGFAFCGEAMELSKSRPARVQIAELRKEIAGGFGDAARYSQLAKLYANLNEEAEARAAWGKSAELFREQVKNNDKDGWLRAQFGRALTGVGDRQTAEERLREAVTLSPGDWRCWASLADFTVSQAWVTLGVTNTTSDLNSEQQRLRMPSPPAAPERLRKVRELRHEAGRLYDKAVACAPEVLAAYEARICYRSGVEPLFRIWTEREQPKESTTMDEWRDSVADMKKAAEIATNNPYAVAMAAFIEAVTSLPKDGSVDVQATGLWPALPDNPRVYVSQAISRLEKLGGSGDTNVAGSALAALGGLQAMVRRDLPAAEENLRRAGKLRPAAEAPSELLSLVFVQSQRWQELAKLREERVKVNDTVRNRLLLAKSYLRAGISTEVRKEVEAALRLDPNDLLANTAMASLLLMDAKDERALAEVGGMMARIKQSCYNRANQKDQMAFEFVHGLYFALAGNREEAAGHFHMLREADPGEPKYRDALDALGY